LYFTDVFSPTFSDGSVQRIEIDGTGLLSLKETGRGARGIAVDEVDEGFFVTDIVSDEILFGATSQGALNVVVAGGLTFPIDLSIVQRRLVWLDQTQGQIASSAMDGTDRQLLLSNVVGASIAYDPVGENIYFEERSGGQSVIRRMDPDATNLETIISNVPYASAMGIDSLNETIFWSSSSGLSNGNGGIYRVNFDGSGFDEIFLRGDNLDTGGLAVDEINGLVYFAQEIATNRDSIMRIELDGSNPTVIADGFGAIVKMDLSPIEIGVVVPEPSSLTLSFAGACLLGAFIRCTRALGCHRSPTNLHGSNS
jgi:hypothetical protein